MRPKLIVTTLCAAFVWTSAVAQGSPAAIPQVSQGLASPAYINQMPAGSQLRAPVKHRNAVSRKSAQNAAAVGASVQAKSPSYPSVGSGAATELVAPNIDSFFPSVGRGTISRKPSPGARR